MQCRGDAEARAAGSPQHSPSTASQRAPPILFDHPPHPQNTACRCQIARCRRQRRWLTPSSQMRGSCRCTAQRRRHTARCWRQAVAKASGGPPATQASTACAATPRHASLGTAPCRVSMLLGRDRQRTLEALANNYRQELAALLMPSQPSHVRRYREGGRAAQQAISGGHGHWLPAGKKDAGTGWQPSLQRRRWPFQPWWRCGNESLVLDSWSGPSPALTYVQECIAAALSTARPLFRVPTNYACVCALRLSPQMPCITDACSLLLVLFMLAVA